VKSAPGFLVNRALTPYLLEALVMLDAGMKKETIDKTAEDFGMTCPCCCDRPVGEAYRLPQTPRPPPPSIRSKRIPQKEIGALYHFARGTDPGSRLPPSLDPAPLAGEGEKGAGAGAGSARALTRSLGRETSA
jgi:hypothetical protein